MTREWWTARLARPWTGGRGLAVALLLLAGGMTATSASAQTGDTVYGPYGPEGRRLREQLWIVPDGDSTGELRATVFRPAGGGNESGDGKRRPMVVINHGTSELTRLAVSMPVYYWLSRWFVERGYVVVLPQRRGHGATGGTLVEAVGNCADPDHFTSGQVAADDIAATIIYMSRQSFVEPGQTIVVGVSTGGWASLALASRTPAVARAVINFAGGRGGHAFGKANAICGRSQLVEAAHAFATTSAIPTLWLYSVNDSYFGPDLAHDMFDAWRSGGGKAELELLPTYHDEGHDIVDDMEGWDVWGERVTRFLDGLNGGDGVHEAPEVASAAGSEALPVEPAAHVVPTAGGTPDLQP